MIKFSFKTVAAWNQQTETNSYFIFRSEGNYTEKSDQFYDVVIVGAGIAGLAAARTLLLSGIKNIIILEGKYWFWTFTQFVWNRCTISIHIDKCVCVSTHMHMHETECCLLYTSRCV